MRKFLVLLMSSGIAAPCLAQQVLYVSPTGDDAKNGCCVTSTAQGGPIRTIQRGQELVRAARAKGSWPAGGFVITLLPGRYEVREAIKLDGRDSGDEGAPVIYRGTTVNGVRASHLVGSVRLAGAARSTYGTNFVRLTSSQALSSASEVILGNEPLLEARWPNRDYSTIASFAGGIVSLTGGMPALPAGAAVTLAGYLHEDWLFESIAAKATATSAANGVRLLDPNRSIRAGARAVIRGSATLLDAADEYVIEPGSNSVLVAASIAAAKDLEVSVTPTLVSADGVSNVRIESMVLCNATADGLLFDNVKNVTIANVEICNTNGWGARIAGQASGVRDSYIHATGAGGVYLYGGNRQTLAPGAMFMETSIVENIGRRVRTYSPAVLTEGVGSAVKGNIIKDSPHVGIMFSGNDHLIAFNDISEVVKEAGDMGAIYAGRDWTMRGNTIRANLIYDILAPGRGAGRGVYLDDQFGSATVESNIFSNVKFGVFIGGGRDNMVRRNVFFGSDPAIFFDARGLDDRRMMAGNQPTLEKGLSNMPINSAVWTSRYPELARIRGETPMAPIGNRIHDNVFVDGEPILLDGKSASLHMTGSPGLRATVRSSPAAKWLGTPRPQWVALLGGQAPGVQEYFPWAEFELMRQRAVRSR